MFNESHVKDAMDGHAWTRIPFCSSRSTTRSLDPDRTPSTTSSAGSRFIVTSSHANGNTGIVKGSFEKVIWEGIQSQSGNNLNYGTTTIELVE